MNPFGVKVHIFGGNTGKQEIKQFRWAEVKEIKIQLNLVKFGWKLVKFG